MSIRWFTLVLLLCCSALASAGAFAKAVSAEPAAPLAASAAWGDASDAADPADDATSAPPSVDAPLDGPDWASPTTIPVLAQHRADPVAGREPHPTASAVLPTPDRPPRR